MRSRNNKRRAVLILILILGLIIALFIYVQNTLKPVLGALVESQGRIITTKLVNEAVLDVMYGESMSYNDLIQIKYNEEGAVSALIADTNKINMLESVLTLTINNALLRIEEADIGVPIGTLLGAEIFSGRGPEITLKMTPSPYVDSQLLSSFESSGINQTRHIISVEYTVSISAILSPYTFEFSVPSSIVIAETIIVGAVPEMFAGFSS